MLENFFDDSSPVTRNDYKEKILDQREIVILFYHKKTAPEMARLFFYVLSVLSALCVLFPLRYYIVDIRACAVSAIKIARRTTVTD